MYSFSVLGLFFPGAAASGFFMPKIILEGGLDEDVFADFGRSIKGVKLRE